MLKIVLTKPTKENWEDEEWKDLNDEALNMIQQYIYDSHLARVQRYKSANKYWKELQPPSSLEVAANEEMKLKMKKLHQFRSIDDYLSSMETSYGEIQACNGGREVLTEIQYLITVINGLAGNENYANARSQLFAVYDKNPNDLNMHLVSRILKAEELRIAQTGRTAPKAYQAWEGEGEKKPFYQRKNYKNQYKRVPRHSSKADWVKNAECFNCGKKGHPRRDCGATSDKDEANTANAVVEAREVLYFLGKSEHSSGRAARIDAATDNDADVAGPQNNGA